ncbi:unnamed protein product [Caenorhabditis sp. 36 PRJEB53466]|nr:unnamed protein product [Caenorhabditis sp. 36 PRJEB53466]
MSKLSAAVAITSTVASKVKTFVLGDDTEIIVTSHYNYPVWFYVIISIGIAFCSISCGVWFFCAICRLRQEKPCNHTFHEAYIITEGGPGEKQQKSEKVKHDKKLEALGQAESLAKSFKSRRSKKSTKSSKKSSKRSSKKEEDREEEKQDEEGAKQETPSGKSKASKKSSRNKGGHDQCAIEMGQNDEGGKRGYFRTLASGMYFPRK